MKNKLPIIIAVLLALNLLVLCGLLLRPSQPKETEEATQPESTAVEETQIPVETQQSDTENVEAVSELFEEPEIKEEPAVTEKPTTPTASAAGNKPAGSSQSNQQTSGSTPAPTQPPATQPTRPPATQPTQPPATQPTQPPATQPTQPPATQPTQPPATQPNESDDNFVDSDTLKDDLVVDEDGSVWTPLY